MSETARQLTQDAMKAAQVLAAGETPKADDENDAFRAMKYMLRSWSQNNIRIPYSSNESITLNGSASYSWGSGGDITTTRPEMIRGAYIEDIGPIDIIGEDLLRRLKASTISGGYTKFMHYSPSFPTGTLYPWPLASDTIVIDTLKELTEPTTLTADASFPKGYDEAIKYNLAVRICADWGRPVPPDVRDLAISSMNVIETRNFAAQMNEATLDLLRVTRKYYNYNIDQG